MILLALAYAGGILTILSPCILPVLPFVFARADQPFVRSGLPLLVGMALTFAAVATLAAVGGGWAVQANQIGRHAAMAMLAVFGLTLVSPRLSEQLTRPLVALGSRLSESASGQQGRGASIAPSFLLGIATGLLWAPCAGPILGLVLTGAALSGASAQTTLLLVAYAAGAATSLALALAIGGRVFTAMKRSLGAGEWIRRVLGVALLAGVAAIALGLDTGVLAKASLAGTGSLEQSLVDRFRPARASAVAAKDGVLPVEGTLPPLDGAVEWINSPPLSREALRGKVVLVDFWTYSCVNCLRSLPYVRAWADKYRDRGLVVIGVHTPEFAFEKVPANVRKAVSDLQVGHPVAVDSDWRIWRAFSNEYWPAHYVVDAQGRIRHHHFGEGSYEESERVIQKLLAEAGAKDVPQDRIAVAASGVQAAADMGDVRSPETYLGYARAQSFASPGGAVRDAVHDYTAAPTPALNEWGLGGAWTIGAEEATLARPTGRIACRFHARDLHLVLGPGAGPARFRVTIDGKPPGGDHGADVDPAGDGTVDTHRLYQLVRLQGPVSDHLFEIEFLDPGVQAFAFTFG